MEPEAASLPRAAEAAYLTEALQRAGVLSDASVRDVAVETSRPTILSRIIRLRLAYDGSTANAPSSIILKTGLPERMTERWIGGRQEVAFYRDVASTMTERVVPRCFDANWDAETNDYHLLLEDLSGSHAIATTWPLPPSFLQCERIIGALARFHAAWWDDGRLGKSVGTWRDAAATGRLLSDLASHFARFADLLGDALPPDRRVFYERLLEAGPRLMERYETHRSVTIVHGDAHAWNCFLPCDGGDDARLFDWDSWRIGIAAGDLVYLMAMHWYPDRRQRLEQQLLDRYHATLLAHGVRNYDRDALDEDYRWAVLWATTTPIWQGANNIPPVIWWNHMERILLAADDWGCHELLA